jgi:hypothetical protein
MKRRKPMRIQRSTPLIGVWLLLLQPIAAWAQSSITGTVRDTSGGVLPGVTVTAASPALIEGFRVGVTDGQGLYRIVDLRPGPYTVTFTLVGFSTVKREGIDLPSEFTATVNVELAVGSLEETVTVSGEAPVVDIRSTRAQVQFAHDTMETLPGAGRLAILSAVLPGATLMRETDRSVGGLNDRGQNTFYIHGTPEAQPVVDGVNVMMNATQGLLVYNQLALQEVVLETSGVGADRDSGALLMNMVSKDGGNTFSGTGMFAFAGGRMESNNWSETLGERGVPKEAAKSLKRYRDTGFALGGPLQRDRLWFFGAVRDGVNQQYAQGLYYNKLKQPASYLFEPDLSKPAFTNEYARDFTLRLTSQVGAKHKIVFASSFQPNCNCVYDLLQANPPRAPEATGEHRYNPNYQPSASWSFPASNRVLLEAGFLMLAHNQNDTSNTHLPYGLPDVPQTDIRIEDQGLNLIYGSVPSRTLPRRQYQERFSVAYVTGSHNFKSGVMLRHAKIGDIESLGNDLWMHGTAVQYRLSSSHVPNRITLLDAPWNFEEHIRDVALYAQDQWTIKKLTVNLGARYNDARASTPVQVLGRGFWVPERRLEPTDNVPHWRNLSPRLGVAYDLFGTGRTALKASLGHYPDRVITASANPAANMVRTTNVAWNDVNRNFVPDCNLLNPTANGECGPWQSPNFGKPRVDTIYTPEALGGFNKQMSNWQGSVSVQHELRQGVGLNVGYFRTWYGGFLATDNPLLDPASYDPYCITAPVDNRLPSNISGQSVCGFYDVKPAFFGVTGGNVKQASDFGTRTQVYNGVDVNINARFGRGAQVQGGISVGRTVADNCLIVDSPEARPGFCNVTPPWSAGTQAKFLATYPLPLDIQASVIYQNVPGNPIVATFNASNANVRATLGRDLTACTGSVGACSQTVTVQLLPVALLGAVGSGAQLYEDRLSQVDLRFARTFRLPGTQRLKGSVDILNLLNTNSVLRSNGVIGGSTPWLTVLQILTGRLIKVSAQFDF